jgi:hypothetical protein
LEQALGASGQALEVLVQALVVSGPLHQALLRPLARELEEPWQCCGRCQLESSNLTPPRNNTLVTVLGPAVINIIYVIETEYPSNPQI